MRILTKAYTQGEVIDSVDYAFLSIYGGTAAYILKAMDLAAFHRQEWTAFSNLTFHDATPDWLQWSDELDNLVGDNDLLDINDTPLPQNTEYARATCGIMDVDWTGEVSWHAIIKHTNIRIDTGSLNRELMEQIVKGDQE